MYPCQTDPYYFRHTIFGRDKQRREMCLRLQASHQKAWLFFFPLYCSWPKSIILQILSHNNIGQDLISSDC